MLQPDTHSTSHPLISSPRGREGVSSNLLKLESTALFTCFKAQIQSDRWAFFRHARECGYPINVIQTISPYRASLHFAYVFESTMTLVSDVYLEREVEHEVWHLSFTGLQGKAESILLNDTLKPLADQGYYIPNGNENLERQMNFSLGLYGDCLMHVDIHFPNGKSPIACVDEVFDHLEKYTNQSMDLIAIQQSQTDLNEDDETGDGLVIMGDWQTWK